MHCELCDHLLSLYEQSARVYSEAVQSIAGTLGDDYRVAFGQAERLSLACQDASDRLMQHWRERHGNLAIKRGA